MEKPTDGTEEEDKKSVLEEHGGYTFVNITPEETYDPEDTKWDQLLYLGDAIMAIRSSNPDVPELHIGMSVIFGGESNQQEALIAGFEPQVNDNGEPDVPRIMLQKDDKKVPIDNAGQILKAAIRKTCQLEGVKFEWIRTNLSVEVPDTQISTWYKTELQEDDPNGIFFIAVGGKRLMIRILDEHNFGDARVRVKLDGHPKFKKVDEYQLENAFLFVDLPEIIEVSDGIVVQLFKKER